MFMVLEKNRCPVCGSFGTRTGSKNIFVCPRCSVPFNEFGMSSITELDESFYYGLQNIIN